MRLNLHVTADQRCMVTRPCSHATPSWTLHLLTERDVQAPLSPLCLQCGEALAMGPAVGPRADGSGKSPLKQRRGAGKAGDKVAGPQPRRKIASSNATTPVPAKKKLAKTLRPPFAVDIPTSPVLANFLSPLDVVDLSQVCIPEQFQALPFTRVPCKRCCRTAPQRRDLTSQFPHPDGCKASRHWAMQPQLSTRYAWLQ